MTAGFARQGVRGLEEALVPGQYTVRDGAPVTRRPSAFFCPYCEGALTALETPGALRVVETLGPLVAGTQHVAVDPAPPDVVLLKCDPCDQIFSAKREEPPHA